MRYVILRRPANNCRKSLKLKQILNTKRYYKTMCNPQYKEYTLANTSLYQYGFMSALEADNIRPHEAT